MLKHSPYRFRILRQVVKAKQFYIQNKTLNKLSEKEKLAAIISFFTLFLILLTWILWTEKEQYNVWELVPDDAILVFESPNILETWDKIEHNPNLQKLSEIPYFSTIQNRFKNLLAFDNDSVFLKKYLEDKTLVSSLHLTGREDWDYLFYIPVESKKEVFFRKMIEKIITKEGLEQETRIYKAQTFYELIEPNTQKIVFQYIFYKHYFIGSYSPFLVEDVLRKIVSGEGSAFFEQNTQLLELVKIDQDDANIYVNFKKINGFLKVFVDDTHAQDLEGLSDWASTMMLDFFLTKSQIKWHGYSLFENQKKGNDFLQSFIDVPASKLTDLQEIIPLQTAILYRQSFANGSDFYDAQKQYWQKSEHNLLHFQDTLADKYGFESQEFFSLIQGELALAILETSPQVSAEKLLFFKLNDAQKMQDLLFDLSQNVRTNPEQKIEEIYQNWTINRLNSKELPSKLLGNAFSGFPQSFFTIIKSRKNDYLVISPNAATLRYLYQVIEEEEVWAKSVRTQRFLEKSNKKTHIGIFIDLPRVWNNFENHASAKMKKSFQEYKYNWFGFEFLSIGFHSRKDKVETFLNLTQQSKFNQLANSELGFEIIKNTGFNNQLRTKPFVVKNHINRSREILVQDAANKVHLIGKSGKILWSRGIGSPIVGEVQQIDLYKNGKLQYLFATPRKIYLLDRKGRIVKNYPIVLPLNVEVEHLSVLDYDKSKKYRILLSDKQGNLYMYDKKGKILNGWSPRKRRFASKLATPALHIRTGGKDCILAVQANGMVNLIKRNSQMYKGFPIKLGGTVSSPLALTYGSNRKKTQLTTITDKGELLTFNLEGKFIKRQQFYRAVETSSFKLCLNQVNKKDWIIARQDIRNVSILNAKGEILFEKTFPSLTKKEVQYYNFGANVKVIAISDPTEQRTYLYTAKGELIQHRPIKSASKIALLYFESKKTFQLYRNYDKELAVLKFGN